MRFSCFLISCFLSACASAPAPPAAPRAPSHPLIDRETARHFIRQYLYFNTTSAFTRTHPRIQDVSHDGNTDPTQIRVEAVPFPLREFVANDGIRLWVRPFGWAVDLLQETEAPAVFRLATGDDFDANAAIGKTAGAPLTFQLSELLLSREDLQALSVRKSPHRDVILANLRTKAAWYRKVDKKPSKRDLFFVCPVFPEAERIPVFWENERKLMWIPSQEQISIVSPKGDLELQKDVLPSGFSTSSTYLVRRDWAEPIVYNCVVDGDKIERP